MSSWLGLDLFGSGPHRFIMGKRGHLIVNSFDGIPTPNYTPLGLLELQIEVHGRLVAPNAGALAGLRIAIESEIEDPPKDGTLISNNGLSWVNMSLVRFDETEFIKIGRHHSVGYIAVFHRFS